MSVFFQPKIAFLCVILEVKAASKSMAQLISRTQKEALDKVKLPANPAFARGHLWR